MPNYFDYMLESADSSIDDMDDYGVAESVYNEMDASMCEFDSYVQEGVGVAIAASVGGAALIGGLIALLVKCFGKSSPNSAAKAAQAAKEAVQTAARQGTELPGDSNILMLTTDAIEEEADEVIESLDFVIEGTRQLLLEAKDTAGTSGGGTRKPTRSEKVRARKEAEKAAKQKAKSRVSSMNDMAQRYDVMYTKSVLIGKKEAELKKLQRQMDKGEKEGWLKLTDAQKNELTAMRAQAAKKVTQVSQEFVAAAKPAINKPAWVSRVVDKRQPATV
jgi:hypothetical protein